MSSILKLSPATDKSVYKPFRLIWKSTLSWSTKKAKLSFNVSFLEISNSKVLQKYLLFSVSIFLNVDRILSKSLWKALSFRAFLFHISITFEWISFSRFSTFSLSFLFLSWVSNILSYKFFNFSLKFCDFSLICSIFFIHNPIK